MVAVVCRGREVTGRFVSCLKTREFEGVRNVGRVWEVRTAGGSAGS